MTVLKRFVPVAAVAGALALPMYAQAGTTVGTIQDIQRTERTLIMDGGKTYRVPAQVAMFDKVNEGDKVHLFFQDDQSMGAPRVTRISRAEEEAAEMKATDEAYTASGAADMNEQDALSTAGVATVEDIDRTGRSILLDNNKIYRVPAQVAAFDQLEEGDRIRFADEADESLGVPYITHIWPVDENERTGMRGDAASGGMNTADAGMSGNASDEMAGGNVATVEDVDLTAGTLLLDDGQMYRVPAQVAGFDQIEAGDKIRFWAQRDQSQGNPRVTRIVKVDDDRAS